VPTLDTRVISIGCLSAHPLWGERASTRTGHATTTLVRVGTGPGSAVILVDPGLPPQVLAARLGERAGIRASDVTHVFLTSFQPECRRGLPAFDRAEWLISDAEREAVGVPLAQALARLTQIEQAADDPLDSDTPETMPEDQAVTLRVVREDVAILQRCRPAPDRLAPGVDLFPLPGVTPGLCGLLVAEARRTTLICGDAVATAEHLERGQVLPGCWDRERAQESFREALEIADVLVLGRDNSVAGVGRG
jgi:glyoxylase-like metal-dependent hydrolase (beta-lactamase superfamily II)